MHRLIKPIFWTLLFLAMLLVIDQFLVLVPPVHPAHEAVSKFYTDFRGRLIDLFSYSTDPRVCVHGLECSSGPSPEAKGRPISSRNQFPALAAQFVSHHR